MFAFVITIHVIACILLIIIVLIQQGKGGGLIDTLSSAESIFGTKTNTLLVKVTSILSVIFFMTCLSLTFLSIRKNKSLIETSYKPKTSAAAVLPQSAATVPSPAGSAPAAGTPQTIPAADAPASVQ